MTNDRTNSRTLRAALLLLALAGATLGSCAGYDSNREAYDVRIVSVTPEIVQADDPVFTSVPMVAEATDQD